MRVAAKHAGCERRRESADKRRTCVRTLVFEMVVEERHTLGQLCSTKR